MKHIRFNHIENNKEKENNFSVDNEFYFNPSGMIVKKKQYSSDKTIRINTFAYNKNSLLIWKNSYSGSNDFLSKSKFESVLNDKRKLIKLSEYKALEHSLTDSKNNLIQYSSSKRMSPNMKNITILNNSRIIKNSTQYEDNGSLFDETIYKCIKYDTRKNCIKYKLTGRDSTISYINSKIEYYN